MNTADYAHPLFASATVEELQQHLKELRGVYEIDWSNESYRILRTLNELAPLRKGLRLDTKHGLASFSTCYSDDSRVYVRFDGDKSATGIQWKAVKTFWFEME